MHAQWNIDKWRILSAAEITKVIKELRRKGNRAVNSRQNLIIFRLATCCGLRVSEIAGLKMRDVEVKGEKPSLNLPKAITKGNKPRRVPLWWNEATFNDIVAWKDERRAQGAKADNYFVCSQSKSSLGNKLARVNLWHRFKSITRVLNRPTQPTIHDGRHTFISHALANGCSLPEVRDAVGHSSIAVTNIYTHVLDDNGDFRNIFPV